MSEQQLDITNRFSDMGDFGKEFLSNKRLIGNCIGLVLFKPDAVASRLDLPIEKFIEEELSEFTKGNVHIFAYGQARLNNKQVREIYSDPKIEQYVDYIESHLTSGPVLFFLVLAENAPENLNKIKGNIKTKSGVRGNFSDSLPIGETELENWREGKLDKEKTREIGIELFAANLLHIPDNKPDTIKVLKTVYPEREIKNMQRSIPIFDRWYRSLR